MPISAETYRERFATGQSYEDFVATAPENAELWKAVSLRADVAEEMVARAKHAGRGLKLCVLNEAWCIDSVSSLPYVARLASLAGFELRVIGRDANPEIMKAHLTGRSRSIPVVIVLDPEYRELGWWGPRPREMQEWFMREGRLLEKAEKNRRLRQWYARDRGMTTVREVVELMESVAGATVAAEGSGG